MSQEHLGCPCCGAEAEMQEVTLKSGETVYRMKCTVCGCRTGYYLTRQGALEEWEGNE